MTHPLHGPPKPIPWISFSCRIPSPLWRPFPRQLPFPLRLSFPRQSPFPLRLVVMDELGSGTDPAEGMGIAVAIMEELKKSGCLFLVTTHYPEVKESAHMEAALGHHTVQGRGLDGHGLPAGIGPRYDYPSIIISYAEILGFLRRGRGKAGQWADRSGKA